MIEKEKRIEWIDTARGIGILMVMFGHNYLDWKYVFWCYAFHMALFFFLSGCTFRIHTDFKSFLKKRVQGLLIPYVFFAVIITAYNWVSAVTHSNTFNLQDTVLCYLLQVRYTHLWFLPCLFLAELGMWFISRFYPGDKKKNRYLVIAGILIILFFVYRSWIGVELLWNADLAVLALSFMLLGLWYSLYADRLVSYMGYKSIITIVVLLVHFCITWIAFVSSESVDWYSNRFGNPFFFVIGSCTGVLATILISKQLHLRPLIYLGANSIMWYGLHRIIIDATFILYNKLHVPVIRGSISSVVLAVISVSIAVVLLIPVNIILTKYFPFLIGKRKGLKKK